MQQKTHFRRAHGNPKTMRGTWLEDRMKRQFTALVFTLLLLLSPAITHAQSGNSSIQGTISDTSGAVIQDASVALMNTATGVVLKAQSDASGSYSFPTVRPGIYSVEVTKDGFASYKISQFKVIVGQHATENAALNIASSSAMVVVNASGLSNLLDTESNDLGTVIGPQSVQQLPLNGRNFLQLGLLSGATQPTSGAANSSISQPAIRACRSILPVISLTSPCM